MRRALALDPADDDVRRAVIEGCLNDVDYQTHHLGEGLFLGDLVDALAGLQDAEKLLGERQDVESFADLRAWCARLRCQVDDWREFSTSSPGGTFRDWCAKRGREHSWPKAYYYDGKRSEEPE